MLNRNLEIFQERSRKKGKLFRSKIEVHTADGIYLLDKPSKKEIDKMNQEGIKKLIESDLLHKQANSLNVRDNENRPK
jgi:hypothetical protein